MAEAFVVGVTTEITIYESRAWMLYAVLADTPEQAIAAVRERVSLGSKVDRVVGKLSPETVDRLGLQHGQARAL